MPYKHHKRDNLPQGHLRYHKHYKIANFIHKRRRGNVIGDEDYEALYVYYHSIAGRQQLYWMEEPECGKWSFIGYAEHLNLGELPEYPFN